MKNIRYISFATVLIALFMSVGAFAQDVNLSVDKCYLQSGGKAQVTVKIANKATFGTLKTDINLPEGLSFVMEKEKDGVRDFAYSKTKITNVPGVTVVFCGADDNKASLTIGNDYDFAPCEGDFFVFDVNVAEDFAEVGDITFSDVKATRYDYANKTWENWKQDGFTAKVYNENKLFTPSVDDFEIAKGGTKAVNFGFAFETVVSNMSFNVELPEGLAIDGYTPSKERIPTHEIVVKKSGRVSVMSTVESDDVNFIGTEGTLFTFNVTATENFKGGEIKFYNLEALPWSGNSTYYAKDFTVNVKATGGETGINGIETIGEGAADGIYQLNGVRTDKLQRGVNIVVKDGKAIKVVKK